MAQKKDPFDNWREWLDRSERQINNLLGEITASPTFGKAQARMMETLLKTQQGMNHAAERYFTAINVPTRTDILEVGGRLGQVEERLANIEAVLLSLAGGQSRRPTSQPRPARTKKPPAPASEASTAKVSKKRPAAKKATAKKATAKKATAKKATAKKAAPKKVAAKKKATKKKATKKAPARKTRTKKARPKATRKTAAKR